MCRTAKEKANPELEFPGDLLMQRLHKNQMKVYKEIKDMNGKELSEYFRKKSDEFRKKIV